MSWAFLDDHANENEKLQAVGEGAAWYWACGLMYCRRKEDERRRRGERVDFIPEAQSLALWPTPKARAYVKALVDRGLWERIEGGYAVHDYHDVYGRKPGGPATTPAGSSAGPADNQPTPSQLGGMARASRASRGPAGRFQPETQPAGPAEPAPRASGSYSYSGSDLKREVVAEDLTGHGAQSGPQPPPPAPSAEGSPLRARLAQRTFDGAALPVRVDPLFERIPFSAWFPSQTQLDWAATNQLTEADVQTALTQARDKLTGFHDFEWFDSKVNKFLEVEAAQKQGRGKFPVRNAPLQNSPTFVASRDSKGVRIV